jgi:hypothetical protein
VTTCIAKFGPDPSGLAPGFLQPITPRDSNAANIVGEKNLITETAAGLSDHALPTQQPDTRRATRRRSNSLWPFQRRDCGLF